MGRIVSSQIVRSNDADPPRLNNIAGNSATAVASAPVVFYSAEFTQNGLGETAFQEARTISSKNVSGISIEYLPTFFPPATGYSPTTIGYQVTINFQSPFENTDYVPIVMSGGTFITNVTGAGPRFNSQCIGQEYSYSRSGPNNAFQKRTTILGAGNEIKQTTSFTIASFAAEFSSPNGGGARHNFFPTVLTIAIYN